MLIPYSKSTPRFRRLSSRLVQWTGCGETVGPTKVSRTYAWTDSLSGYKNTDWRKQIENGQNATTELNGTVRSIKSKSYYLRHDLHHPYETTPKFKIGANPCQEIWGGATMGHMSPAYFPSYLQVTGSSITEADNRAKEAFVNKIRNIQTSFQGGVFLGEFLETVRLIRGSAKTLYRGFGTYLGSLKKDSRKIRKLTRKRRDEAIAERWLEYSFGWSPLINDIDDGARTLAESKILSEPKWKVVSARGDSDPVVNATGTQNTNSGTPFYSVEMKRSSQARVHYYGAVDVGTYSVWSGRRVGLDLSNFLPTVWELVPWSFAVDYFTNISEIVSAASLATSSIRWMGKTTVQETYYHDSKWIGNNPGAATVTADRPGSFRWSLKTVSRGPYVGSLVPTLTFSTPGLSMKWLNLAALSRVNRDTRRALRHL